MKIEAVIFDMDGLMLDTEKLLVRFWCEAAREYGFPMERRHALELRSFAGKFAAVQLKEWFGESCDYKKIRARRIELMNAYIKDHPVGKKVGLDELLDHLKERGIRAAVATATDLERAKEYLIPAGIYDKFERIICGNMIQNGKPCPDIYLYACSQLGLEPERCMALEDSPNGVRSASDAGCVTVMVPDLTPPAMEQYSRVFAVCETLRDVIGLLNGVNK